MDTKKSTETPWGLTWTDLIASLQFPPEATKTVTAIADEVTTLLAGADIAHTIQIAGSHGCGTALPMDRDLYIIAKLPSFDHINYHATHIQPMLAALKPLSPRQESIYVTFSHTDFTVFLSAAGDLYHGPESLLTTPQDQLEILLRTSCEPLRADMVRLHSPLARDMCRVAKKWLSEGGFLPGEHCLSDYLTELLMLHAMREAPHSTKPYSDIFREFLSLLSGASGVRTFLMWEWYYPRRAVDDAMAKGLVQLPKGGNIVIIDPAAPCMNLAADIDWIDVRAYARKSLDNMQSTELVETLQLRLAALTKGVEESISGLQRQVVELESLSSAPRRWSGVVQFGEACMCGDAWTMVTEAELRGVIWRVNARQARGEVGGYSGLVDVSLQALGRVKHTIDVDVHFRGGVTNLVFDDKIDHVLIAKKSEVVRNRDYPLQITIIS